MKCMYGVLLSCVLVWFSGVVVAKERLILLPPGGVTDQTLSNIYRTALSEALNQQYEVLSGTQVDKKLDDLFAEESRKAHCTEEACYKAMVLAFQSERVAIAQVKKLGQGYLLSLQINNLLENKQEYSKTLPCRQCDEFDVQAMLKQLVPVSVSPPESAVIAAIPMSPPKISAVVPMSSPVVSARPPVDDVPKVVVSNVVDVRQEPRGENTHIAGMPFVWVSPGCFKMGVKKFRKGVCLESGFWLGKTEVTQEDWQRVMGDNPSENTACGSNCPVESVSFVDAQQFISVLNQRYGGGFGLPTEAEWEYACRSGGKKQKFCGRHGVKKLGWFKANSTRGIHPVGRKKPNDLGLYDMSGNVWEWTCSDWKSRYQGQEKVCSDKADSRGRRALRGGSWKDKSGKLRAAMRVGPHTVIKAENGGVRLRFSQ
jgi:formylglycine-generating enzyme required for sulfatase activity/deoxycytidylate deaminase